jgi:ribosome-associated toxin RatA of RatAB toxin-antitoxin module
MGAMLRLRAPMGAVFSSGFYGGPFQYLWGPFSILSEKINTITLSLKYELSSEIAEMIYCKYDNVL